MRDLSGLRVNRSNRVLILVEAAVFSPVGEFTMPGISAKDGAPQFLVKPAVVHTRLEEAWVLTQGFLTRKSSEGGKSGIRPQNLARAISNHNCVICRSQN